MKTLKKHWPLPLILILLGLSALLGCNKPAPGTATTDVHPNYPPPGRTLSILDIGLAMQAAGISCPSTIVPDAVYVMPTRRWVEQDFSTGFTQFKTALGVTTWTDTSWDCDKFSIACSFYAKWLNQISKNRHIAAALAVGELYYLKNAEAGGAHAINVFIVQEGDVLQLLFYEPQTAQPVTLSSAELKSVSFWKF